jgi:hypothetical protein
MPAIRMAMAMDQNQLGPDALSLPSLRDHAHGRVLVWKPNLAGMVCTHFLRFVDDAMPEVGVIVQVVQYERLAPM